MDRTDGKAGHDPNIRPGSTFAHGKSATDFSHSSSVSSGFFSNTASSLTNANESYSSFPKYETSHPYKPVNEVTLSPSILSAQIIVESTSIAPVCSFTNKERVYQSSVNLNHNSLIDSNHQPNRVLCSASQSRVLDVALNHINNSRPSFVQSQNSPLSTTPTDSNIASSHFHCDQIDSKFSSTNFLTNDNNRQDQNQDPNCLALVLLSGTETVEQKREQPTKQSDEVDDRSESFVYTMTSNGKRKNTVSNSHSHHHNSSSSNNTDNTTDSLNLSAVDDTLFVNQLNNSLQQQLDQQANSHPESQIDYKKDNKDLQLDKRSTDFCGDDRTESQSSTSSRSTVTTPEPACKSLEDTRGRSRGPSSGLSAKSVQIRDSSKSPVLVNNLQGKGWDCSVCTYRNSLRRVRCLICDGRKGMSTRKPRVNSHLQAQQVARQQQQIQEQVLKASAKQAEKTKLNNGGHTEKRRSDTNNDSNASSNASAKNKRKADHERKTFKEESNSSTVSSKESSVLMDSVKSSLPTEAFDRDKSVTRSITVNSLTIMITEYPVKKSWPSSKSEKTAGKKSLNKNKS